MTHKINFMNDYNTVAHPEIVEAIKSAIDEKHEGYGLDERSETARKMIREMTECPQADVQFLPTGTLANLTSIASFLRPHEAVIAQAAAHINIHETGAIEAVGHKILTIETHSGKLCPADIPPIIAQQVDEHMVKPKMLYISQTTEKGTVYTTEELSELRKLCDEEGLVLYIDGARLSYALVSDAAVPDLKTIAKLCDAFYIGGAKCGILFGEALVVTNPKLQDDLRYLIKQRGGLVGKGFLMGIQFEALLRDRLDLKMAGHANELARKLTSGLAGKGVSFDIETESNQVFPIVTHKKDKELEEKVIYEKWRDLDEKDCVIRFCTSWATTDQEVDELLKMF